MGSPRAALLALLFALRGASAGEIAVSVAGGQAVLAFDGDTDLAAAAHAFADAHGLEGGEGCEGRSCVVDMLVTAMRQDLGGCAGSAGDGCVTRTSVSGAVYRAQGAEEVSRQEAAYDVEATIYDRLAMYAAVRPQRRAAAPCAPPYCDFECAIGSAAFEDEFARAFIEEDDELRRLMVDYPAPRRCPGGRLYPIFIGIPASEFVDCAPRKYRAFQGGVKEPGAGRYAFEPHEEAEYKRAYREAYFGVTKKKAGWDCMRHYEIAASGARNDARAGFPHFSVASFGRVVIDRRKNQSSEPSNCTQMESLPSRAGRERRVPVLHGRPRDVPRGHARLLAQAAPDGGQVLGRRPRAQPHGGHAARRSVRGLRGSERGAAAIRAGEVDFGVARDLCPRGDGPRRRQERAHPVGAPGAGLPARDARPRLPEQARQRRR